MAGQRSRFSANSPRKTVAACSKVCIGSVPRSLHACYTIADISYALTPRCPSIPIGVAISIAMLNKFRRG
jgi:hypothetical protein